MLDQPYIRPRPAREERVMPAHPWEAAAWENENMRDAIGHTPTQVDEYGRAAQQVLDGAAGDVFTVRQIGDAIDLDYEGARRVVQKLKYNDQIEFVSKQKSASGRWEKVWRLT